MIRTEKSMYIITTDLIVIDMGIDIGIDIWIDIGIDIGIDVYHLPASCLKIFLSFSVHANGHAHMVLSNTSKFPTRANGLHAHMVQLGSPRYLHKNTHR